MTLTPLILWTAVALGAAVLAIVYRWRIIVWCVLLPLLGVLWLLARVPGTRRAQGRILGAIERIIEEEG